MIAECWFYMFRGIYQHLIFWQRNKYTHVLYRTSNSQNPRSRRDEVIPGRRREHAQHVSSLKIYFRSRLTAFASQIIKSLITPEAQTQNGGEVTTVQRLTLTRRRWVTWLGKHYIITVSAGGQPTIKKEKMFVTLTNRNYQKQTTCSS